ncbi:hypothetical protein BG74_08395 [Sodalis-like endosymbiont of Proechinophthirus fluctus]|nr:hypothetical protein BG74_08395 [Sodalis-like endosymbiont of Proechinophthirus fluctus]
MSPYLVDVDAQIADRLCRGELTRVVDAQYNLAAHRPPGVSLTIELTRRRRNYRNSPPLQGTVQRRGLNSQAAAVNLYPGMLATFVV